MSDIYLKQLAADSPDVKFMRKVNTESFPPNEYIAEPDMFVFGDTDIRVLGIYQDDLFAGFFTVIVEECCVYITYFAVDSTRRGRGIGSEALKALFKLFDGYQIVVDFEAFDESGAPNPEERLHRRNFYFRNGFHATGHYMYYMDTEFEVACSNASMNADAFQKLLDHIHALAGENYPGIMYKREPSC